MRFFYRCSGIHICFTSSAFCKYGCVSQVLNACNLLQTGSINYYLYLSSSGCLDTVVTLIFLSFNLLLNQSNLSFSPSHQTCIDYSLFFCSHFSVLTSYLDRQQIFMSRSALPLTSIPSWNASIIIISA